MITDKVKELLKKYIQLCAWFLIREGDQSISAEQFEVVLNEIGDLETQLFDNGVSEKAIEQVVSHIRNNTPTDKPINEMTEAQQLRLCKAIFGEKTHWQE